jgi:hypothetical protein
MFKIGDHVFAGRHKAEIINRFKTLKNGWSYRVKFQNKRLIPSEMDYLESDLISVVDSSDCCPFCGTEWKVSYFGKNVWKDCIECNEKAEVLLEEHSKIPEPPKEKRESIFSPFANLNSNAAGKDDDDDDDDDFGFYQP